MEALESHRREITVVFCDLRGFTAFAETAEPEEVMNVLREYHAALGVLIHEFEGTLERFVGDGVLVLFNDPIPCPDPCLRAARMAAAMRERLKELAARWRASATPSVSASESLMDMRRSAQSASRAVATIARSAQS